MYFLSFPVNVLSLQQALTAFFKITISILFTASPDGEMVSKIIVEPSQVHFVQLVAMIPTFLVLQDEDSEFTLATDFEIGHFFRERIVPRAVLYFTGEAMEDDESVSALFFSFFFLTHFKKSQNLTHCMGLTNNTEAKLVITFGCVSSLDSFTCFSV